ncbi:MAG TPA: CRISPR-associated protein Cas5 [Chitinophaga sp.]|uniref:CRISPR-associated protein Cas5 n=1 Tax=Chitinophaga sp. TaxID=1869181 RepID=UPI002C06339C|nr:CRISPR-associated protein Cas5 [Chitinophaga sp.]HVI45186.1 CRISPR-associated protein Cas5 [Chitinophaga sp.]
MAKEALISFDLKADFGFLKKPDYNDGILLSYNMLHKPALLGILGAITGMAGYSIPGELPEYYTRLSSLAVGIAPLNHEKGIFQKTTVKYTNTAGYANDDGTLLIEETMLVKPGYRCYLLLDLEHEEQATLYMNLKNNQAVYIPYMGKNEYQAWLDGPVTEYNCKRYVAEGEFSIDSLFIKDGSIRNRKVNAGFSFASRSMMNKGAFCYFERLPVGFDERLRQYNYCDFAFTDWVLKPDSVIEDLYEITDPGGIKSIIQLF